MVESLLAGCSMIVRMARVRGAHGIKAVDDSGRCRNTEAGVVWPMDLSPDQQ